jgi:hypothetical protein
MNGKTLASLVLLALTLTGCVVAPVGPPRRVYYGPAVAVVAPPAVVGVGVVIR